MTYIYTFHKNLNYNSFPLPLIRTVNQTGRKYAGWSGPSICQDGISKGAFSCFRETHVSVIFDSLFIPVIYFHLQVILVEGLISRDLLISFDKGIVCQHPTLPRP